MVYPPITTGKIVGACLKQCGNVDHLKSGYVKLTDVRPILFGLASMGLTDVEVVRIIRAMPRDSQGAVQYTGFRHILEEVWFD